MWVDKGHYYELLQSYHLSDMESINKSGRIAELKCEVEQLKEDVRSERDRADRALDTQLMARGQAPIADPGRMIEADDPFVEDPAILSAMHKEMEQSSGSALRLFVEGIPVGSAGSADNPDVETIGEE